MSGKKRMATVLSESESDEEERSKTLGSAASTSKAQKIRHNPKSSASTRPSGVAASLTAPAQDRSTSNRLSPSIVNESADLSNLPMTGQGAANLHNVSDIKKHIESLNTHISFLKSELGALKEAHIQQRARYDTQVDFLYDQLRKVDAGNGRVIPPLPFGDKPCPEEPDPKCTTPRPMSAVQLAKLSEVLKKAANKSVHQGQFEMIMRLDKAPEVYPDSQIDLNALTSRQKWLLYFVNRKKNPLSLVDILTEEEKRVIQTATEAVHSTETVEDDRPVDQQLLTPGLHKEAREKLREAMYGAAATDAAAAGDDESSVMAISEQEGDGVDVADDADDADDACSVDAISGKEMFGEDSDSDSEWPPY